MRHKLALASGVGITLATVLIAGPSFAGASDGQVDENSGNDSAASGLGVEEIFGGSADTSINGGGSDESVGSDLPSDTLTSDPGPCAGDATEVRSDVCRTDSDGPVIAFLDNTTTEVQAGETAVFRWTVADADGAGESWASIGGPPGWITEWCGFAEPGKVVGGTAFETVFELQCPIPSSAPSQTYTIFIGAVDVFGNPGSETAQRDFIVIGGSSDTSAPELTGIRAPGSVTPGVPFTIELDVTDESDVVGVQVWLLGGTFAGPEGSYTLFPSSALAPLTAGSSTAGTYQQEVTAAPYAPPGTYNVWVSLRDSVGNRHFIDSGASVIVEG